MAKRKRMSRKHGLSCFKLGKKFKQEETTDREKISV